MKRELKEAFRIYDKAGTNLVDNSIKYKDIKMIFIPFITLDQQFQYF